MGSNVCMLYVYAGRGHMMCRYVGQHMHQMVGRVIHRTTAGHTMLSHQSCAQTTPQPSTPTCCRRCCCCCCGCAAAAQVATQQVCCRGGRLAVVQPLHQAAKCHACGGLGVHQPG
jgi:hypothetical protein